jgi:hypothetical protein
MKHVVPQGKGLNTELVHVVEPMGSFSANLLVHAEYTEPRRCLSPGP